MSDGYDIELKLSAPTGGLDDYMRRLKAIEQKQKRINAAAGANLPAGPAARYQKAIANLSTASAVGTPTQQFDAGAAVRRTRKAYEQAMKDASGSTSSAMGEAFKKALSTPRIGVGPGGGLNLMPLIDKLGAFGPLGMAATALAGVFETLKAVADGSTQAIGDFASAQASAGGTAAETAKLNAFGKAADLTPQQTAGAAMGFAQSMAHDPFAMQIFGKYGIRPDFDPEGKINPDKAGQFIKGLDAYLNKMNDQEAARAVHAAPSLQPFAKFRHASPATKAAILAGAGKDASYYSDPKTQNAADAYETAKSGLGRAISRKLGTASQDSLTPLYNSATKMIESPSVRNFRAFMRLASGNDSKLKTADRLQAMIFGKHAGGAPGIHSEKPASTGLHVPPHVSSLDANTQAVRDLTLLLHNKDRQIFGGGERARAAVPAGWRYNVLEQAMQGGLARHLGAFVQ